MGKSSDESEKKKISFTRNAVYKKRSKNLSSLDFDFLYSCFLISRKHFG